MVLPVAKKEIEAAKAKRERQLVSDMRKAFGSDAGVRVLRWLMIECGYQGRSVVANKETQEIYTKSTVYNEARRNLYLQLREYLPPNILIPVEIEPLTPIKPPTKKETTHGRRTRKD